jgi:hypothetical protein
VSGSRARACTQGHRRRSALAELFAVDEVRRVVRAPVGQLSELVHAREAGMIQPREDPELVAQRGDELRVQLAWSTLMARGAPSSARSSAWYTSAVDAPHQTIPRGERYDLRERALALGHDGNSVSEPGAN